MRTPRPCFLSFFFSFFLTIPPPVSSSAHSTPHLLLFTSYTYYKHICHHWLLTSTAADHPSIVFLVEITTHTLTPFFLNKRVERRESIYTHTSSYSQTKSPTKGESNISFYPGIHCPFYMSALRLFLVLLFSLFLFYPFHLS